jgi:hypothetical protein
MPSEVLLILIIILIAVAQAGKDLRDRSGRSGRLRFARRLANTTWRTTMAEANKLTLDSIRGGRLPGAGTDRNGRIVPRYSTEATGPEVTHYLVTTLEEAPALLGRARRAVDPELLATINEFIGRD